MAAAANTLFYDINKNRFNFSADVKKAKNKGGANSTAIYCRLSRDDGNTTESNSISSQKEMLRLYAKEQGFSIYDYYIDDGFSGTNFERPEFQRMLTDVGCGHINTIITKDLSRLGRNYVQTGLYSDFFQDNDVRIIAINDSYDTKNEDNDIAPFKHILNEMYAKDISKKIRSSRKLAAKQGKFMGSVPPYGYMRDPANKHKLVTDEPAAAVVKQIFEMFCNHESARSIASYLNNEGLLSPQNYYYQRIEQENPYGSNAKTWCAATVTSILKNHVYLGNTIQSKRAVKSFKTKQVQKMPPEMWVVVNNTHEPIVDKQTWSSAQLAFSTRKNAKPRKTAVDDDVSLFSGLGYCKCCNSRIVFGSTKRATFVDYYYRCSKYVQHGKSACTPHRIKYDTIYAIVLEDIKRNAAIAQDDMEAFIKNLHNISVKEQMADIAKLKKRESQIKRRQDEIANLIQKTFEKNVSGLLPDDMFADLLQQYKKEKEELESELSTLHDQLLESESRSKDIVSEVEKLKQFAEIMELNRQIVTCLVQSIHISEPKVCDGEKTYGIEIRYKFQNPYLILKKGAEIA